MKRRCGWLPAAQETRPRVVWSRRHVATDECPTSLITAQSITWIEEFFVWKRLRLGHPFHCNARQVEAFLILEEELSLEERSAR